MSEGFSRKPRVGGKGGLSPSRLTPGSWGPCLQAGSPQAGLVPLCPLGRRLDGSSCQNPHCPVVRELNKHQVLPFGSMAWNWRLGRTSESTRTEEKKRKLFLIPKGVRSKSGNKPRQNSCSFFSSCFLLY